MSIAEQRYPISSVAITKCLRQSLKGGRAYTGLQLQRVFISQLGSKKDK